jgi:hypothetical protein
MPSLMSKSRQARRRHQVSLVVGCAVVLGAVLFAVVRSGGPPQGSTCGVQSASGQTYVIDPAQAQNAAIIAAVAVRKVLPDHAVTVALAAALQESKLTNLDHGDLDSVGLFQQRPSQGWGTRTQILDPAYAAGAFFDRLATVPDWQSMPVGAAAQAVQLSAVPGAYAPWESEARALARALTGEVSAGLSCRLSGFAGPAPPSGALAAAARSEFGSDAIGTTLDAKRGWAVAIWAMAHAYNYHLQRVAFGRQAWDARSGRWSPDAAAGSVVTVDLSQS